MDIFGNIIGGLIKWLLIYVALVAVLFVLIMGYGKIKTAFNSPPSPVAAPAPQESFEPRHHFADDTSSKPATDIEIATASKPKLPAIEYKDTMTALQKARAENVMQQLIEDCTGAFQEHPDAIEWIKIEHVTFLQQGDKCEWDFRCEKWGWKDGYHVQAKIKDDAIEMQQGWSEPIIGHTLHYDIGEGDRPGISILKFPFLCGLSNGFSFKPLPVN